MMSTRSMRAMITMMKMMTITMIILRITNVFTDLERSLKAQQRERGELKKKRKSRTAFTNSQIYELEKR